ncbi:MAG TPA: carboxypeptidase-like regulatory domain-containing protein [Candidatus Aquilonibacter sp.]|nr:carboxypeptidase-like regulatory domain-containing protein [Candidatus Aquilonibacter sp.]
MRISGFRRACCLIAVALLLPVVNMAQQAQPSGLVQGRAILSDSGKRAEGALVSLFAVAPPQTFPQYGEYVVHDSIQPADLHATVAGNGTFTIDNVPPGEYSVMIYKPGYIKQDPRQTPGTYSPDSIRRVTVTAGGVAGVSLVLQRGGSIEGQVRFDDGRALPAGRTPMDGIAVNVEMETAPGTFARFGGAAHLDAEGRYDIDGLPPARYIVFLGLPPTMIETTRGLVSAGGRLLFAPGTNRASRARVIALSGEETQSGVDFNIPTRGLHAIRGRVIDSTGAPVTQGLVRLYPTGEPTLPLAAGVDRNGEFVFADLPDDSYTVSFESEGKTEFRGVTADGKGIRVFRGKPPYEPAKTDVQVSGQDPPAVILRVQPTS